MIIRPNQYFTERQTPVDFDGVAKLTTIKGNSIVWNQLFDSDTPIVITTSTTQAYKWANVIPNHKYLIVFNGSFATWQVYESQTRTDAWTVGTNTRLYQGADATAIVQPLSYNYLVVRNSANTVSVSSNTNWQPMIFDLTQMGLDSLTAQEFQSLFPLSYYAYNQGTLIAFNGTDIKTNGFNQWDEQWENGDVNGTTGADSTGTGFRCVGYIPVLPNTKYFMTNPFSETLKTRYYDANKNYIGSRDKENRTAIASGGTYFTTADNCCYFRFATQPSFTTYEDNICLNFFDESKNGTYKPYVEETAPLPISTYFSTGMKSAGDVYDELTETKVVTRIGERAYQVGDESDPTVITDMTNTYYPLVTPTETVIHESLQYPFFADGMEILLPQNTTTPSTAPILADISYINSTDTNTPYRKFWLKNANGDEWSLTDKEFRCFLNTPSGLGFRKTVNVTRYGEKAVKTSEVYDFPTPQGELLFYDSANRTRYEKYNEFMRFLNDQPITLFYQIPVSILSGIPDIYSLDCEVTEVQKSESSVEKVLTSSVVFDGLSFYKGDEMLIEGTTDTYTINNPSDFPVGFEIKVEGTLENPYVTLEQDGEVYGEAKFDDSTAFDSIYVNSNDGEQNVILEQSGSVLPNPLSYQDLSISNGSIYVTFVKLAKGESTLTIGMDSGSITKAEILFTPMYRSV